MENLELNGKSISTYGIKSIRIGTMGQPHINHHPKISFDEFISKPNVTNRMGGIQFSKSFRMRQSELNPKTMRLLFGNKWNKLPKMVVCKIKLKSTKFARPVYQSFVFPKQAVASGKQLRSITEFVKRCY